ncbi:MAG TPA: thioesterase domain-containing protein [Bacilli bacterium]
MKLFCFPYAGGTAGIFHRWKEYLDPSIELVPVELAGRGSRVHEPCSESLRKVVNDVFPHVWHHLDGTPYALFGHGMGCLIVYELAHRILRLKGGNPACLIFSGHRPPHIRNKRWIHTLPDNEFQKEILSLGGRSKELFENQVMTGFFSRILRADFGAAEKYRYLPKAHKLESKTVILYGKQDHAAANSCHEWHLQTNKECDIYSFEDGHFFINENEEEVLNVINSSLLSCSMIGSGI